MSIEAYCAYNIKEQAAPHVGATEEELAAAIRSAIDQRQRAGFLDAMREAEAIEVREYARPR